jgi:protocatechuate 3,4-dioxygenase beta subunit
MSKLSLALGILVLPCAFHSAQAQAAESKAGTATVSGRVNLKGEPARGVTVILQTKNQNASNAPRARTDEGGRFHFTSLPAGSYSVFAVAPGYVSPDVDRVFDVRGKTLNLADGEKVENIDLEIKRGGVIAGRVTDSQGRPVIEERVNLSKLEASNQPLPFSAYGVNYDMYRTDDRGFYRVYELPAGRYLVSVGGAEAKMIEVSEGSEAAEIDITVPDQKPKQTYDVYGRVMDIGAGQPVAGVEVVIDRVTKEGRYTGVFVGNGTRSGPNGEFRISGVLPGRYAILTRPGDPSGGGFISDPVIVDVGEDSLTGVEVRVRQGGSISGVVVIEGTNDPEIRAKLSQIKLGGLIRPAVSEPPPPLSSFIVKVNADGSFRASGLLRGRASISLERTPNTRDLVIARIERNGAPARNGIEVDAGEEVTGVHIVLVHGSLTLRGELKVVGGTLPAGYRFYASARRVDQQAQNSSGGEIDVRGQFVIENLPPGEYEIRVVPVYFPYGRQLNEEFRLLIRSVKERVVLGGANQQQVTLVVDLSKKGGDK